jgi:hypothetical protein
VYFELEASFPRKVKEKEQIHPARLDEKVIAWDRLL